MIPARLPTLLILVAATTAVLALGGIGAAAVAGVGGLLAMALAIRRSPLSADPSGDQAHPAALADAVLDGIDEPVLLIDDGRVTIANRAALALLGRHIVGQDARLAIRDPAATLHLTGEAGDPDGEPVRLEGLGAIGQLWEMRVATIATGARVVRLTDRSAGAAAERMRTDFVANASHELRTPLASILGYVETLQGEAGEAPPVRARFLQVVFDEASRMQRLVQDLMSLSRVEADRFRPPADRVDLGALAGKVVDELAVTERGRDVALTVAPFLPPVFGDSPQLSQLLHNIVGNALAYGRPGTPVTMAIEADAGEVRLTVADRGDGIAPEHLPRLTERFYRADAGRSRAAGGTGLGLAIVKHIVERHRGRLSIGSVPGIGTTVTVRLPPAPPAVTQPQ